MISGRAAIVVRLNLNPGSAEHRAVLDLLESRVGPVQSAKTKRQLMGQCAIDLLSHIARGVDLREEPVPPVAQQELPAESRNAKSPSSTNEAPRPLPAAPPAHNAQSNTPDSTASIDVVLDRLDELDMVKVVSG